MINSFDFVGADLLKPKASLAANTILAMRAEIEQGEWPVIYVNDNFG
ncbi:MAG: hypothetical protein JWO65_924, partial [Sphingomonas bacterium]|nr:hypothetical protein [Sphingomonas bacterium]